MQQRRRTDEQKRADDPSQHLVSRFITRIGRRPDAPCQRGGRATEDDAHKSRYGTFPGGQRLRAVPDEGAGLRAAIQRGGWPQSRRYAGCMTPMNDATHGPSPQEPALKAAPDADLVTGALSYAETEALEDFAGSSPEESCRRMAPPAALAGADRRVASYRGDLRRFSGSWRPRGCPRARTVLASA
jgi:hypothetical protein